jgi:uncharacterized protein (DUF885 family)
MLRRPFNALWVALFLISCGGGGAGPDTTAPLPASGPTPTETLSRALQGLTLDEFYATSYEALLYRTPETIVGQTLAAIYPLDEVRLDNISAAYRGETFAMYEVVLDALRSYDRSGLDAADRLTYDFYEWYLEDAVDARAFLYYPFVAAYNFMGEHTGTETFFTEVHPLRTAADAEDYITRLRDVPRKFDDLIAFLDLQSGAGIVEPRLTLDWSLYGINQIADAAPSTVSYFTAFRDKLDDVPGLGATERDALRDAALAATRDHVIPAYRALRNKLEQLRSRAPSEIGVGQYPRGDEFYAYMLRHRTTTDLTAAEIHQLGLDHLQRVHAEMHAIFDELGYPQGETLPQLFQRVVQDSGVIPAGDVKTTYEAIIEAAELELDQAFDIFPSADVVVAEDDYGGFYIAPSFDGSRPGAFYASTRFDEPWYRMPSLTYHEAIPGHHTQVGIAMDIEGGPAFRRTIRFTAFIEGWALYAERLAWELGWYENDPYGNLGRLQYEALRAARLVIDTGIHSLGWTFEQAVQFNIDAVGWSRAESENAVARYSVAPGQATAYMVGMLRILGARERARETLGEAFDLKEFHRLVLTSGGLPLALLDEVVDQYIAAHRP